ncbi:radical SAM protein [Myxococcota bacterium]|nr:radical SAM protein [Myxococcota bacterium]
MLTTLAYRALINKESHTLDDLPDLLSPVGLSCLEELADRARIITRQRFGNTISLYAPLYISNICVNRCVYCGFNVTNHFPRVTLTLQQVEEEARALKEMGFAHVLLLTGRGDIRSPHRFPGRVS